MTPKSALISCYDKSNLENLASALIKSNVAIFASGGTFEYLQNKGIPSTSIVDKYGITPVLDGRVKTLHPLIFSGLLADRSKKEHINYIKNNKIQLFDILISNLYPFITATTDNCLYEEAAIELIDIGGVSLIRAAAKNFRHILVVTQPDDYSVVKKHLLSKSIDEKFRRILALKAFKHTYTYDKAIFKWLEQSVSKTANHNLAVDTSTDNTSRDIPDKINLNLSKILPLRYGENPHQKAGLFSQDSAPWKKWQDKIKHLNYNKQKIISFNNLSDAEIGYKTIKYLRSPACVIIKHGTACGIAEGENQTEAWKKALLSDPISAYGGIVVFNSELENEVAILCRKKFIEVIIAPHFSDSAIETLSKKTTQLLVPPPQPKHQNTLQTIQFGNGVIAQETMPEPSSLKDWCNVFKAITSETIKENLEFAWKAIQQVRSNAVIIVANKQTLGIGSGFTNRIDATKYALSQTELLHSNNHFDRVCASDAFFPFTDNIDVLAKANIKALVLPAGAKRQDEIIASADKYGIAIYLTNERQFRH